MVRRYTALMQRNQPLPKLWLLSDERNDSALPEALNVLPRGSGFIYRHYHLQDSDRLARFQELTHIARSRSHAIILADSALTAREWGADGIYGAPRSLYPRRRDLIHLATAHNLREIGLANRLGADAVLLSPVFATRSHPGGQVLGTTRFRLLAVHAEMPVIALGGMDAKRVRAMDWERWAAIDGLSR